MSDAIRIGSRRVSTVKVLLALLGLAVLAALFTPDVERGDDNLTTYSTSTGGARIVYELAQRMGWKASRREAPLDSAPSTPNTQVVIGIRGALGAHEVHALLDNVRRGGGLIFSVDAAPEIADSLGLRLRARARLLGSVGDSECRAPRSFSERQEETLPPTVNEMVWRRPAPGRVTALATLAGPLHALDVAIGFPLGRGRVAAVSAEDVFANGVVRVCGWDADVAVARSLEYVRGSATTPSIVFDEFHHGFGVHGGSFTAIAMFLSRTSSGHFLAQGLIAALILLLAAAPRPIVPRDPERVMRRSPLEHADALGHAYADVGATRTATSRLVGGLRRRAGRTVSVEATAPDRAFLDAVVRRTPLLAPRVEIVRRALDQTVPPRELTAVGEAIAGIEQELLTSPPSKS